MLPPVLRGIVLAAITTATCAAAGPTLAQNAPLVATTDPAQADADFQIQGEYWGEVLANDNRYEWRGLQVVALGNGKFQAVVYRGGLPGNGWDQQAKWSLTGARQGAVATLSGPTLTITLDGYQAVVRDLAGRDRGQWPRVERSSPTLGAPPPPWATVLFDGATTENLTSARITPDGLLEVGADTRRPYRDFSLHVEFRTPYMPTARGQARGNSGVYIQGRYEVQILDSFGLDGVNNECGSLYKTRAPDLNMCLPPLSWQTYDIEFQAARFDASGAKTQSARITVRHNGVVVQNNVEIPNKTGGGVKEGPDARPIKFQNHNNPVHYRNLWIVELQPAERPAAESAPPCDCTTPAVAPGVRRSLRRTPCAW